MKYCLFLYFALIFLTGCRSENAPQLREKKFVFIDDLGREVSFDTLPNRIISMMPSITENIFAIGARDKLIGITTYCNFPPETKNIQKVGDLNPDYELITALNPDLIFIQSSTSASPMLNKFTQLGLNVFVANPTSINEIISHLETLGEICGRTENARKLCSDLSDRINFYSSSNGNKKVRAFVILSENPLTTVSGKTFLSSALELAGFLNIFSGEVNDFPVVSYEDVLKKNPEIIFLPVDSNSSIVPEMLNNLQNSLETTTAVKNKNIKFLNPDVILRSTPRLIYEIGEISSFN
ncbi:hypothetical protein FBQ84_04610 [Ignavibacteria bacterium CHB1]|nr:MAG: hypothetical protein EDM69_05340 [Chlorobiota bacterium]MBV6398521.1 Vitamin B12-binding protein [Ignavibacteria bacterium]MCC6885756.1 ABC transporter substrate-binding protein [Ignavibacteriales bacterium]MCE7953049.1 hypothetical protein [Chlorobi bacterium CHB7]MDL1887113.1 hypothetical protein [Ignavibacteria bacterium CHB1]RIK49867.1 MAG: hypothetical protein DCC60_02290 [Ignavibacteriota bacterium]